jgi:hypothetical protein
VAVELVVERIADHNRPTLTIESGVGWRWTDPDAADRDVAVRGALARLASHEPGSAGPDMG